MRDSSVVLETIGLADGAAADTTSVLGDEELVRAENVIRARQ